MAHGYTSSQELTPVPFNLGATVAAGTGETWVVFTLPATIPVAHLMNVDFTNGASLAANGTNFTTISVQKGASTVMASFATDVNALTADTAVAMTRSATLANRKLAPGDVVKIVKADSGTGAAITAAATVTLWFRFGTEDLTDS